MVPFGLMKNVWGTAATPYAFATSFDASTTIGHVAF